MYILLGITQLHVIIIFFYLCDNKRKPFDGGGWVCGKGKRVQISRTPRYKMKTRITRNEVKEIRFSKYRV